MRSLADDEIRREVAARLEQLRPESPGLWGKMTAPQMICHVGDQLRVALGEIPSRDRSRLLTRTLVKWLVIHAGMPAPKGRVRTVREMQTTQPGPWPDDVATLCALIERSGAAGEQDLSPHPVFGRLSPRQWAVLGYVHLDHHLRQFGV